ncbi:MAG: hypothetical protein FWF10_08840 [Clostridiales bacterium]|nr:hypothetical protein [Clostridiales bacterium]
MGKSIDKRGRLDEEVFAYRITKDKKVFISWHGKQVTILSGKQADRFISDIAGADGKAAQLLMAKATGHFKHGNEKMNR